MIEILDGGLQTTLQDGGRPGYRHFGVPLSGYADRLSAALANRLVGKDVTASLLEITLTGFTTRFGEATQISITGAATKISLNNQPLHPHQTHDVAANDILHIGPSTAGARIYLACTEYFLADQFLGSGSTYLPAALGGHQGRRLQAGDKIATKPNHKAASTITPTALRPMMTDGWVLRYMPGPDVALLQTPIDTIRFTCGRRADRMGLQLTGNTLSLRHHTPLPSAPVFPGTIQCPPDGLPFLLLSDAQTTGGYAKIAQVIQADLHITGQIKPGDTVRLIPVAPTQARQIYRDKLALFAEWLGPDFRL